jgi:hypothetical protein
MQVVPPARVVGRDGEREAMSVQLRPRDRDAATGESLPNLSASLAALQANTAGGGGIAVVGMRQAIERPTAGALKVPYMVDATRHPIDFKAVDAEHVERCAKHQRCGVCGGRIRRGPFAFVGPLVSHGRGCFADPWMHPECADLAMQQCPFLAGRRDWRDGESRDNPLLRPYSEGMHLRLAPGARSHKDQLGHWHFEAVDL